MTLFSILLGDRRRKLGQESIGKPKSALLILWVKILHNMLLIITRGGK